MRIRTHLLTIFPLFASLRTFDKHLRNTLRCKIHARTYPLAQGLGLAAEDIFVIDGGIRAWAGLGFPTDSVAPPKV